MHVTWTPASSSLTLDELSATALPCRFLHNRHYWV
jgi:hypothetical protein